MDSKQNVSFFITYLTVALAFYGYLLRFTELKLSPVARGLPFRILLPAKGMKDVYNIQFVAFG